MSYERQATWFIDPANVTGRASDSNSGLTRTAPLLSFGEIVRRWGTTSPTLRQDTLFAWLSSQPAGNDDPVIFEPVLTGTVVTMQGDVGDAQKLHTGFLSGVVAKNRGAHQLLEADLGFAAPIGSLVQNTTLGKASLAWVFRQVSGTVFELFQPMSPPTLPVSFAVLPVEIDTWANNDSFDVFALVGANVCRVMPKAVEDVAGSFAAQVQLVNLHVLSANGPENSEALIDQNVAVSQCVFDSTFVDSGRHTGETNIRWNCFLRQDALCAGRDNPNSFFWGGGIVAVFESSVAWNFDYDAVIVAPPGVAVDVGTSFLQNEGTFYIEGTVRLAGTMGFLSTAATSSVCLVWGPGTLDTLGQARVFYAASAGAAAATFQNTGGLRLNAQSLATTFEPSTGAWITPASLTPANLDDAAVFAGLAINPGGACFTNQANP